jgi:predicted nucleotidyltransferase
MLLLTASEAWSARLGERLVSLILFGSVARGKPSAASDIDLLIVADGFPKALRERRRPLLEEWERIRSLRGLPMAEWNLVTKSREEARFHSPLYLDIVEDGILLVDKDGFFAGILEEMRARMRALGSRRIFLSNGSWYWDLKPDFRFGEVVEI